MTMLVVLAACVCSQMPWLWFQWRRASMERKYLIIRTIALKGEVTGLDFPSPTWLADLRQLEADGVLESRREPGGAYRGGRDKVYYRLAGRAACADAPAAQSVVMTKPPARRFCTACNDCASEFEYALEDTDVGEFGHRKIKCPSCGCVQFHIGMNAR